jgi:CPA2 family monovalent cation:H+ antiporter-2
VVAEVVPMRNLFATLFFVSIGMLIDPAFIWRNLPAVLGLALFIVTIKAFATLAAVLPFGLGAKTAVFTGLGLVQIGEFSYVLAAIGRREAVIGERLYGLILTSSVVTIVLTPFAFTLAPRLARLFAGVPVAGRLFAAKVAVLAEEQALAAHAIVIGYGRVGRHVVAGLREAGLPLVVIEEDLHLVQELSRLGIPAVLGDASHRSILAAAHPERARLIVVALPDSGATRAVVRDARRANPEVPILARLVREGDEAELRRVGATSTIGPERAGAMLLLEESARVLNIPPPSITTLGAFVADEHGPHYRDDPDAVGPWGPVRA